MILKMFQWNIFNELFAVQKTGHHFDNKMRALRYNILTAREYPLKAVKFKKEESYGPFGITGRRSVCGEQPAG